MPRLTVQAGDFTRGEGRIEGEQLFLPTPAVPGGERIALSELATVEVANEETARDMAGTLGWGAAGALLLGPVGLLAGLLLGGKTREVTFVARFKDGRRLLATVDSASYTRILAAVF